MKEKNFQTKFKHWIKNNQSKFVKSTAFELKIEKGKSLRFDRVAKHQRRALFNSKHKYLYWKLPDSNFLQKPYDCVVMTNAPAYVVVWFYKPRQSKFMLWIDIDTFITAMFKFRHTRKSLKEQEWLNLADFVFEFK